MVDLGGVQLHSPDEMPADYGRWLIHGPQGSGKTTLASSLAQLGKTLFIDLTGEKGIRAFAGAPYEKNITIARPESVTALDDVFWELDKGSSGFDAVVVDSLTGVQKMTMRYLQGHSETAVREIRQGAAPTQIQTWGQSLEVMQDLATFWHGLADGNREKPMHVVMTAQTRIREDEVEGTKTRHPDVQPGALSIVRSTPDYILYTEEEEDHENVTEDGEPSIRHVVRFGPHPGYQTKARIPYNLRGKLPAVIGRGKNPPDLAQLSRVLQIGGTSEK